MLLIKLFLIESRLDKSYFLLKDSTKVLEAGLNFNPRTLFNQRFEHKPKKLGDFSSSIFTLFISRYSKIFFLEPLYLFDPSISTRDISNSLKTILAGRVKGISLVCL